MSMSNCHIDLSYSFVFLKLNSMLMSYESCSSLKVFSAIFRR